MIFPEPVISVAIEPKTKADQETLMNTLARLEDEDPTFRVNTNAETGQLLISGMGELHLDIIVDRLMREFNIQANVGKPVVTYKETVTESAQARHVFEKVVAGKDQFGDVTVLLGPAERGAGFVFVNSLPAGVLPGDCLSAIEAGFRDSVEAGVIAGYKMVDVRAELKAATFDENKSVNVAYRIAANQALKEAARKGNPALMEPIMKLEIVCPDEYTGDVINDLNSRRGKIENITYRGELKVIDASVPLSEVFGYATNVRSITQGRASHTLQFSNYELVPENIKEKLIARMRGLISY
jgi:elongation factor G